MSDSDFTKAKLWIFGTLSGILATIAGWLAIQLYNGSVKQTDILERRLNDINIEQTRINENIIRLQENIKAMQSENEKTHATQNNEIEVLKDQGETFWQLLIQEPYRPKKKK